MTPFNVIGLWVAAVLVSLFVVAALVEGWRGGVN